MDYTQQAVNDRRAKREKYRKVRRIITYIIIIPLLLYNIVLILQAVIKPQKTPSIFGIKTYVIVSGSMMPNLNIGDIAIIKEEKTENFKKGDIISFRRGKLVITHRIENVIITDGNREYVTKGDNNNVQDNEMVKEKEIEGKLIAKIPYLGKLTLILKNEIVIIIFFIIYYIYLVKNHQLNKKKEIRNQKRLKYEENNNEYLIR